MVTSIQQRLLDLAADIASTPPEDLAFTHSVLAQTSLPTAKPPEGMLRWERRQGRATLLVVAGCGHRLMTHQYRSRAEWKGRERLHVKAAITC